MKRIPINKKEFCYTDLSIDTTRSRSSFSGTAGKMSPRGIEDQLKHVYSKQTTINDSIIRYDKKYPGSNIENYVTHRIFEGSDAKSLIPAPSPNIKTSDLNLFTGSYDEMQPAATSMPVSITHINMHPVNPSDFFSSKQHSNTQQQATTSFIMVTEDEVDGRNLFHYQTLQWSKPNSNFWKNIKHLYRIDLTHLLDEDFQKDISSLSPEEILAKLIVKKIADKLITADVVLKSLKLNSITGILFEGFNDIHPYLERNDYELTKRVIDFALKQYNAIVICNIYSMNQALRHFEFSKIMYDKGFLRGDKFAYIYKNFHGQEYYETLVDFFKFNKPIQEASKSPSFLTASCYIIANLNKLTSGTDAKSFTISSLLYNLYHLVSSKFESKSSAEEIAIKNKFIKFVEEFAFLQLKSNSINIEKLLEKHEISIEIINSLTNHIPIIKIDPLASKIKHNYIFRDKLLHNFIAALYIEKMLESGDLAKINYASTLISSYREQIQFLKFLGGLITTNADASEKTKLMDILFKAIESNTDNLVRIDRDNLISLQMEIISECQLNGNISPYISLEIINFIDHTLLSDIKSWHPLIVKTKYNSHEIQKHYNTKLFSSNHEDQLLAIDYYSSIAISDKNTRKSIADRLKKLVLNGENYAISENALTALEAYDDIREVKELFEQILRDEDKVSIIIATLGIYLKDADPSNINLLLELLNRSENPFVILKTLETLDRSHKEETNNQPFLEALVTKLLDSNDLSKDVIQAAKKILIKKKFDFNDIIKEKFAAINFTGTSDNFLSIEQGLEALKKLIDYKILDSSLVNGIAKNIYSKFQKVQATFITTLIQPIIQPRSEEAKVFEQHTAKFLLKIYPEIKDSDIRIKIKDSILKKIRDGDEALRIIVLKEIDSLFYSEYNHEVLALFEDKLKHSKLSDVKTSILQVLINSLKSSEIQIAKLDSFKDIVISYLQRSSEMSSELTENSLDFLYYYFLNNSNDLRAFINTTLSKESLYSKANYFKILSLLPDISSDPKIKDIFDKAIFYENSATFKEAIHAIGSYIRETSGPIREYYLNKLLAKINTLNDFTLKLVCLNELKESITNLSISGKTLVLDFIITKINDSATPT